MNWPNLRQGETLTKSLGSFPLTKTRIRWGGSPGHLGNRPDFVLDFGDFWGSTRYRSKSIYAHVACVRGDRCGLLLFSTTSVDQWSEVCGDKSLLRYPRESVHPSSEFRAASFGPSRSRPAPRASADGHTITHTGHPNNGIHVLHAAG